MDLNEWNARLFQSLVVDNGRAGDPLYLYVDDEMLAEIGEFASPEIALEDFKAAFRSTSFRRLAREANFWKLDRYKGIPPFISGLAMTVLAATLPTLGLRESNVYARQRHLLGLTDLESGAPDGYIEYVPAMWKIWNDWLDGEGSQYGVKTAYEHPHFTNQGWARSQSFIRAKDKEEIYSFFRSRGASFEDSVDGEQLVDLLDVWLRNKGVRSRLSTVAGDSSYRDELSRCLLASLKFWTHEAEHTSIKRRTQVTDRAAIPYWDPEYDELSLIVRSSPEFAGKLFTDLGGVEYQVATGENILYLTPQGMTPSAWLDGPPIRRNAIGDTHIIWDPTGVKHIVFERSDFDGWVQTTEILHGRSYRVLLLESPEAFEPGFEVVKGPQDFGYWLRFNRSDLIPGEKISLGQHYETSDNQNFFTARFKGGLKLARSNTYLVSGEPDLEISGVSSVDEVDIVVDEEPVRKNQLSFKNNAYLLRIRQLRLSAGEHTVIVKLGSSVRRLTFRTIEPRKALGDQLGKALNQPSPLDIAPRVYNRKGSVILLFDAEGDVWTAEPSNKRRVWLDELSSTAEDIPFERMVDLNSLSFSSGQTLAALRRANNASWKVIALDADPAIVGKALRLNLAPTTIADQAVLDFLYGNEIVFRDDGKTEKLQRRVRTALGKSLNGGYAEPPVAFPLPGEKNLLEMRKDINSNWWVSEMNPLDDFMYWLSELPEGATLDAANITWNWLHAVHERPTPLDFEASLRALQSLGHVSIDRIRSRVFPAPTQIVLLPATEGIAVLTGARNRNFCHELRTPSEELAEDTADAIMNLVQYEFAQTFNDSFFAPTTIMLQLGSEDIIKQATALNAQLVSDLPLRLLQELESVESNVKKSENEFLPITSISIDRFLPANTTPGGSWRRIDQYPNSDAFLRITDNRRKKYAWWDYQSNKLYDSGWVKGLWLFHANLTDLPLIGRIHSRSQMLISARVPLPPEFERALVARSGLLPRQAIANGEDWRVYENVPPEVAILIKKYLGQEHTEMVRPARLEFV